MKRLKRGWQFYREHGWLRRGLVVGVYLVISGGLLINYGWLHRTSNAHDDTPLNSYQTFNDSNSQGIKLVSRGYSAPQKRLIATFKLQAATDPTTEILASYLKFKVATVMPQKVETTVIPVTENKYVVLVDGLKPDFQAIRLRLINQTPQTDTTANQHGKVDFIMTQGAASRGSRVTKLTPQAYAGQAIKEEIQQRQKRITKQQTTIKNAQDAMAVDQAKIKMKQANLKYEVASQRTKSEDDIETLRGDIEQNQQAIQHAKQAITTAKKEQALLAKKQAAIKAGTFKLAKVTKSSQITQK